MPSAISGVGSDWIFYAFGIGGHVIARDGAPLAGHRVRLGRSNRTKGQ
jgi:hypothetical protein